MGTKVKIKHHLDKDPNDPRLNKPSDKLASLNDEPEAEIQEVEVREETVERDGVTTVTRVGADPNDPRLVNR